MKEKKIFKTILIAAIIIVVLVIGALSIVIIPAGHTGVVTNFGAVSDSVLQRDCTLRCHSCKMS